MNHEFKQSDWKLLMNAQGTNQLKIEKREKGMHLIQVYKLNEGGKDHYLQPSNIDTFEIIDDGENIEIRSSGSFDGYVVVR